VIVEHDWEIKTIDCSIDLVDFRVCRRCGSMTHDEHVADGSLGHGDLPVAEAIRGT